MKNGKIDDVRVVESPDNSLTEVAKAAIKYGKQWIPGKFYGENVTVGYRVPIRFSLNGF